MAAPTVLRSTPQAGKTPQIFRQWHAVCELEPTISAQAVGFLKTLPKELHPHARTIGEEFINYAAQRFGVPLGDTSELAKRCVDQQASLITGFVYRSRDALWATVSAQVVTGAVIPVLRSIAGVSPTVELSLPNASRALDLDRIPELLRNAVRLSGKDLGDLGIAAGFAADREQAGGIVQRTIDMRPTKVIQASRLLQPLKMTLARLLSEQGPIYVENPMSPKELGCKMKLALATCGMSQDAVASQLGITKGVLLALVNPEQDITVNHLQEFATAVRWSLVPLLEFDVAAIVNDGLETSGQLTGEILRRRIVAAVKGSAKPFVEIAQSYGNYRTPNSAIETFKNFLARNENPFFVRLQHLANFLGRDLIEFLTGAAPTRGRIGQFNMDHVRAAVRYFRDDQGVSDEHLAKQIGKKPDQFTSWLNKDDVQVFDLKVVLDSLEVALPDFVEQCYNLVRPASKTEFTWAPTRPAPRKPGQR